MIQLILFLLVGASLFGSLYFLAREGPGSDRRTETLLEARAALATLRAGLLPPDIVGRILARDDRDYVVFETPGNLRSLFFDERKRIALLWVAQVRRQILSLSQFHRHSARFYRELQPGTEMKLAVEFAALLLACRLVQFALYVSGPYAIPNVIETTAAATSRMCALSEKSLGFLGQMHQGMAR